MKTDKKQKTSEQYYKYDARFTVYDDGCRYWMLDDLFPWDCAILEHEELEEMNISAFEFIKNHIVEYEPFDYKRLDENVWKISGKYYDVVGLVDFSREYPTATVNDEKEITELTSVDTFFNRFIKGNKYNPRN